MKGVCPYYIVQYMYMYSEEKFVYLFINGYNVSIPFLKKRYDYRSSYKCLTVEFDSCNYLDQI